MVALAEWIEKEESAVADPFSRPGETATPSKNRIRRFFPETPDRVGDLGSQVVDRVGFLVVVELRPRQAPSLAQREKTIPRTGTVLPAGQNAVSDGSSNVEIGPLQVLDLGYTENLNLPDLRRLPVVQSHNQDLSNLSIPGQWLPGVSPGEVAQGNYRYHNGDVPAMNRTMDWLLPALAVAPIAPMVAQAGVAFAPYAAAGGQIALNAAVRVGTAIPAYGHATLAVGYRIATANTDRVCSIGEFIAGFLDGSPSPTFPGLYGTISRRISDPHWANP